MSLRDALIVEKVNKWEIDQILKDDDFLVGVEFEFVVPAFREKYAEDIKQWETITRYNTQLDKYDKSLEKWEDNIERYGEDKIGAPPVPPQWAKDLGYEPGDPLPDPKKDFPDLQNNMKKIFKTLIDEFIPINELPFSNIIVSTDPHKKSSSNWIIKPDGSLGAEGVELVSPVMPISEFIKITPKIFEFITKYGAVNDRCGLHIGMSIKGIDNLGDNLDIVKLSLFTDEGYIYKYFDLRKYNDYAKSAQYAVKGSGFDKDKIHKFIQTQKLETEYSKEHYMAINIEHLHTKNEYIEFRYLGGKDYHKKWDRIKNIVAQYGWNLLLACDPDFRRKEYLLKLHNIMLKAELFSSIVKVNEMKKMKTIKKSARMEHEKDIENLENSIKVLQKRIKLHNDDIVVFAQNAGIDLNDINEMDF